MKNTDTRIQDEALYARLVEHLKDRKFAIIRPDGKQDPIPRTSTALRWLTIATAAAGAGPLAAFSSGIVPTFTDVQLRDSLIPLYETADLVGVSLVYGAVRIVLVIEADEIGDELLVGRFQLLHDRFAALHKYSMTTISSVFGDIKKGVISNVLLVFRQPYKADYFLNNLSDKCKYAPFLNWKKVWIFPWAVDIPSRRILKSKGWGWDEIGQADLSDNLFS